MTAPSTSGLSVELLLRVIDVKYGYFESMIQLSQDFIFSNGGQLNRKIPVKIHRCLFEITA